MRETDMRELANYRSMPLILLLVSLGFFVAVGGSIAGDARMAGIGVAVVASLTPIALAYLHFIVLVDVPWGLTWSGFMLGAIGSALILAGSLEWIAPALFGIGFLLIGLSFIKSPSKPTPPGVLFLVGGGMIIQSIFAPQQAFVPVMAYLALALTFAFGGIASVANAIRGADVEAAK
jgi:hypothetical protein